MSMDATKFVWSLSKDLISPLEKYTLLAIANRCNEFNQCWPSLSCLEKDTGFTKTSLTRHRSRLIEAGFIKLTGEYKGRSKQIPVMELIFIDAPLQLTPHTELPVPPTQSYRYPPHRVTRNLKEEPNIGSKDIYLSPNLSLKNQKPHEREKQKTISSHPKDLVNCSTPEKTENTEMVYKETYYPAPVANQQLATLPNTPLSKYTDIAIMQTYNVTKVDIDAFEKFWANYPVKKNKARAKALWFSQGCHHNSEAINAKLYLQVTKDKQFLDGYVPSICNYITGERWQDEIEVKKEKSHFDHNNMDWALASKRSIFE